MGAKSVQSVVNFYKYKRKDLQKEPNNDSTDPHVEIREIAAKSGEQATIHEQVELARLIPRTKTVAAKSNEISESGKNNRYCYNVYLMDPAKSQEKNGLQKNHSYAIERDDGLCRQYEPSGRCLDFEMKSSSPTLVMQYMHTPSRRIQFKDGQPFSLDQTHQSKNYNSMTGTELETCRSTQGTTVLHHNASTTSAHDIVQQRCSLTTSEAPCCAAMMTFQDAKRVGRTVFNLEKLSNPKYTTRSFFEVETKRDQTSSKEFTSLMGYPTKRNKIPTMTTSSRIPFKHRTHPNDCWKSGNKFCYQDICSNIFSTQVLRRTLDTTLMHQCFSTGCLEKNFPSDFRKFLQDSYKTDDVSTPWTERRYDFNSLSVAELFELLEKATDNIYNSTSESTVRDVQSEKDHHSTQSETSQITNQPNNGCKAWSSESANGENVSTPLEGPPLHDVASTSNNSLTESSINDKTVGDGSHIDSKPTTRCKKRRRKLCRSYCKKKRSSTSRQPATHNISKGDSGSIEGNKKNDPSSVTSSGTSSLSPTYGDVALNLDSHEGGTIDNNAITEFSVNVDNINASVSLCSLSEDWMKLPLDLDGMLELIPPFI